MTEQRPSAVTGSDDGPCPYCGSAIGVNQVTDTSPKVQAWSCAECGTEWVISTIYPRPLRDQLTAVELVAARLVLREVIRLADQVPVLTAEQLRFRLLTLAECAAPRSHDPRKILG